METRVHSVFHVSQLKIAVGNVTTSNQLPSVLSEDNVLKPEFILERKMGKRQGRAVTLVLVQWEGQNAEEATWEYLFDLQKKFPEMDL